MHTRNLQLDIFNDGSTDKDCSFTVQRENPLLGDVRDDLTEYRVGVSRFLLPADRIKAFSNLDDFKIGYYASKVGRSSSSQFHIENLNPPSTYKNNSPQDFITNINQTLAKGFYEFVQKGDYSFSEKITHTQTLSSATGEIDHNFTLSKTFSNPKHLLGIKFTLHSFTTSGPVGDQTIVLRNTTQSKEVIICSNQNYNSSVETTFADWFPNAPINLGSESKEVYPTERFQKLYQDADPYNSSWQLIAYCDNDLPTTVDISFTLEFIVLNDIQDYSAKTPLFPPYFSIVDDYIQFNYSQSIAVSQYYVVMTKKLQDKLKLNHMELSYGGGTYYAIEYPQQNVSSYEAPSPLNVHAVIQKLATYRSFHDLYKVIFRSSLPIEGEIVGSASKATANILTDFMVDDIDREYYRYDVDFPHRTYKVTNGGEFNYFTLDVFLERTNGTLERYLLSPGKRANIQITFFKL